jgi:hypothetical protein
MYLESMHKPARPVGMEYQALGTSQSMSNSPIQLAAIALFFTVILIFSFYSSLYVSRLISRVLLRFMSAHCVTSQLRWRCRLSVGRLISDVLSLT